MPHESTVAHEQRFVMETPMISRSRTFKLNDEDEEQHTIMAVNIYFYFIYFIYFPKKICTKKKNN